MSLDRLVDPFGFGLSAAEPRDPGEETNAPMPTPEGALEEELAARAAEEGAEVETPTDDMDASDLDPILRLQETPGTWLDDPADAAPVGAPGEDTTYSAPIEESGGQGI